VTFNGIATRTNYCLAFPRTDIGNLEILRLKQMISLFIKYERGKIGAWHVVQLWNYRATHK
jgi:hypothetical protein